MSTLFKRVRVGPYSTTGYRGGLMERRESDVAVIERTLTKLFKDGRARIVYDLIDTQQRLPHAGLLLKGDELIGWVFRTGWERDLADEVGAIASQYVEAVMPVGGSEASDRVAMHLNVNHDRSDSLPMLCTRTGTIVATHDGTDKQVTTVWHGRTIESLVYVLGMIEIVGARDDVTVQTTYPKTRRYQGLNRENYALTLIPTDTSWDWKEVSVNSARWSATRELEVKAWWKIGTHAATEVVDGIALRVTTLSSRYAPIVENDNRLSLTAEQLQGAVEIVGEHKHPAAGHINIRAWRSKKEDCCWIVDMDRGGSFAEHQSYPRLVSGAAALQLANIALLRGSLPAPSEVPADGGDTLASFKALVAARSDQERELKFICDGLAIERVASTEVRS